MVSTRAIFRIEESLHGNQQNTQNKRSFIMSAINIRTTFLIASLVLVLTACAGRDPKPVAVTNMGDSSLDCASISREFEANERQIVSTGEERSNAQGKNVFLTVTGVVLFWPALFFIDPKSPERVEIEALRNRNKVLTDLAKTKKCRLPVSQLSEFYQRLDNPPSQTEQ